MYYLKIDLVEPGLLGATYHATFRLPDGSEGTLRLTTTNRLGVEQRMRLAIMALAGDKGEPAND